ncbi:hypothetical protein M8C21_019377 [Ambrosia artemisiifolia]|uniref:Acyl-ACP thioesterase-like C-terminal domain-containing protein n=1 Tax=Ambrosia artemisiifolia TaxID=4212 RepID=A0AAD5G1V6_AMBAR|nr:hypothetical protein M8C21_019377 [Ambrosia artemisiifolia]
MRYASTQTSALNRTVRWNTIGWHSQARTTIMKIKRLILASTRGDVVQVMMNKVTRRLWKIPDEVRGEIERHFVDAPPVVDEDCRKLPKLEEITADYVRNGLTLRWKDFDVNQHVNNVKHIGWILESAPQVVEKYELASITLKYRRECRKNSMVKSLTSVLGGGGGDDGHNVRITAGALPRGLHIWNLSKNSISTIEGLRELTRLSVLDLSYNRILRIGHGYKISEVEGLHRLLKLNVLDLRFNKLSTKNVGDEQRKKFLLGLLSHLAYCTRHSIKSGAMKDLADRAARLGISAHQIDRGIRSEAKKSTHDRKSQGVISRGLPPSGVKVTGAKQTFAEIVLNLEEALEQSDQAKDPAST